MLPKIKQPIFTMEIPSTKKSVKYRPFTVAEEKLLMIAKESNDSKDIVNVYRQIITNCILDTIDVDKLAYFDLEYIFLMLRAKSVSNIVELQIKDEEDGNTYPVKYDLDNVKVSEQKKDNLIALSDGITVRLKYPTYSALADLKTNSSGSVDSSDMLTIVRICLDQVIADDEVFETDNYTTSELDDFILSLGSKELMKLQQFFETLPKVYGDIEYKRKDGTLVKHKLEGMQSFFG
jgi:hypothetical protein